MQSHFCDNHNKVLIFVTEAGSYMVEAARLLKMPYPRMILLTYTAHKNNAKSINFLSPPYYT